MNICLKHINLDGDEVIFELCVEGYTVYVYYCKCCGHLSLGYHTSISDFVKEHEEDIYEFIYEVVE
jgi:hypothetical protein